MFVAFWVAAGLCFMGNTSVQEQEQALQGGYHGPGNLLLRKPSLLSHLASLMGLNGSNYNNSVSTFFFTLV
jgi:hypothetical protein